MLRGLHKHDLTISVFTRAWDDLHGWVWEKGARGVQQPRGHTRTFRDPQYYYMYIWYFNTPPPPPCVCE